MSVINFMFRNLLVILLFGIIIYCYAYWGDLIGEKTPAGRAIAYLSEEFESVDRFINGIKQKQGAVQIASAPEREAPNSSEVGEWSTPPSYVYRTEPRQEQPERDMPRADVYVTPSIEKSLDDAVSQYQGAQPKALRQLAPDEPKFDKQTQHFVDARRAFFRRDYASSINHYEQLISDSPDNFDARGELGNVYFNQGDNQKAAEQYYEAASILVRMGQSDRAGSLLPFLRYLDEEKSSKLEALLKQSRSSS